MHVVEKARADPALEPDHRQTGKLGRLDLVPVRERRGGRHGQQHRMADEQLRHKVVRRREVVDERRIRAPLAQRGKLFRRRHRGKRQFDPRERLAETAQRVGDKAVPGDRLDEGQPQNPRLPCRHGPGGGGGAGDLRDDRARLVEETAPGRRQANPARQPLEQRDAQIVLELADLARKGGLGDPQPGRGAGGGALTVTSPYQAFAASAARDPAAVFALAPASAGLPWAPDGFRLTYGEAAAAVAALIAACRAAGWGRGDRVALLLENRPAFLLHWLALNAIGVSAVPLNGAMKPAELAHQMRVSGAGAVIAAPGFADLLAEGAPGVPVAGEGEPPPAGPGARPPEGGGPQDEAALLFTSGSTGLPKACVLSNRYFINAAEWYVAMRGVAAMTPGAEVALTPLPFFHMNALGCTAVGMMLIGGAIVPLDRFHPQRWWATVADSGATVVHALGVIPAILLGLPPGPDERRHRARFAFAPGVAPEHRAAFTARFGLPLVDGWAMTETGGAAISDTAGLPEPLAPRCIGQPRACMEWRIVDEAGRDVPPGTAGELWVRSAGADPRAGFFSGYLGDPGATEAAWACGWFHTGDVMRADAAGLLYFVDRRKSIVRRSGENISALEVEAALAADPAVAAAAVTPVSDPQREEEVFAFVVPAGPAEPEALMRRLAERLSYHKLPGYLAYLDALPVGATAKVQRGQVRSDAEAAVAGGTAIDLRGLKAKLRVEA